MVDTRLEPAEKPTRTTLLALLTVYVIWSSTYLAIRVVVAELPPLLSGGARYLVAGLAMLLIARARGHVVPPPAAWGRAFVVGTLLFVVGNGFVSVAATSLGSGVIAVVCGMMPLWGAVLGPIFGVPASRREWAGLALGFVGVGVLATGGELRAAPAATALLLIAPLGWAVGSLLVRRWDVGKGMMGAATQTITGGATMVLLALALGERAPGAIALPTLGALAYLVLFGSLAGFAAYHHLLVHARPALAMSYAYVNPVLAVILGALLGGEAIGGHTVVGTAFIVGAVVTLVSRPRPANLPGPARTEDRPVRGEAVDVEPLEGTGSGRAR
ncbi:MAG: drug/metabolite exporter YedA [Deltaproteobacteria bacterium]|jgi:drug/metabolite transporter (DMT)-like permease